MVIETIADLKIRLDELGIGGYETDSKGIFIDVLSLADNYTNKFSKKSTDINFNVISTKEIGDPDYNPEILMLVLGDHEISKQEAKFIRLIRGRETEIIPLLIFTEGFFEIPEGEIFGYDRQIENINTICGKSSFPTVAFHERDVLANSDSFNQFLNMIREIVILKQTGTSLALLHNEIEILLQNINQIAKNDQDYFQIKFKYNIFRELDNTRREISNLLEKRLDSVRENNKNRLNLIQRRNKQSVVEKRYPNRARSWLASEFGLEYSDINKQLQDFLAELEKSQLQDELKDKIDDSYSLLDYATSISILGTFSSGKTTFVNTLLGINLRTSSSHNTAILSEIKYHDQKTDKVRFKYKKDISIKIMEADDDDSIVKSPVTGEIIKIDSYQNLLTIIIKDNKGEKIPVYFGGRKMRRNLKKGSRVETGEKLTEGAEKRQYNWFNIYGVRDIEIITKLLEDNGLNKHRLTVEYESSIKKMHKSEFKSKDQIISILNNLLRNAPAVYKSISREELEEFPLGNVRISNIRNIALKAELDSSNRNLKDEIILDDKGWIEYQGDDQKKGFSESPLCYLFVEKAVLYTNNSFLKLSNIIDTPGLGSITDLHDEITERYLRKSKGLILIMIKMDMQMGRETFWKILSLLKSIYSDKSIEGVFFFCNWWRNLKTFKQVSRDYKKINEYVEDYFNSPKIYLCDLEGTIMKGNENMKLGDFPSYGLLKKELNKKIGQYGPDRNLRIINDIWKKKMRNMLYNESNKLNNLKQNKTSRKNRTMELEILKENVEQVEIDLSSHIGEIISSAEKYKDILLLLDNLKTWKNNKDLIISTAEVINNVVTDEDVFGIIRNQAASIREQMRKIGLKTSYSNFPEPDYGGLPLNSLGIMVDKIISDWPLLTFSFGWYRDERREELEEWFKGNLGRLLENFYEYSAKCSKWFESFKMEALSIINREIISLKGTDDEKAIQACKKKIEVIESRKIKWDKISDNIVNIIYGADIDE